jgi:hypothetical protein
VAKKAEEAQSTIAMGSQRPLTSHNIAHFLIAFIVLPALFLASPDNTTGGRPMQCSSFQPCSETKWRAVQRLPLLPLMLQPSHHSRSLSPFLAKTSRAR